MNILREILDISDYKPTSGPLFDLYEITLTNHLGREVAKELFNNKRAGSNFSLNYNRLKNKALDALLYSKFGNLTVSQQERIKIYLFYTQTKILYHLHKRKAFCHLGPKLINRAEALGFYEIAISVCRTLYLQYSEAKPDIPLYNQFRKRAIALTNKLNQEFEIELLYTSVTLAIRKNKLKEQDFYELEKFNPAYTNNQEFKYRYYYYVLMNYKADYEKDNTAFIANTSAALDFFQNASIPLAPNMRFNFLINLVPIYLQQKKYVKVESTLNACESLSIKGSFNWHLAIQYKGLFGFYSNKPIISLAAWEKAQPYIDALNAPLIKDRWEIVAAYLAFYRKIGKIKNNKIAKIEKNDDFRLYRFINEIGHIQKDQPQKANLLVLQFLHLLVDNKIKKYTNLSFTINDHIQKYFNTQGYRRTKLFLQCLRSVVKGRFHPNGAARHGNNQVEKLQQPLKVIDLNLMEKEMVPYDILWKEVLGILERQK